jgi:hypothetical protein
LIQGVRTRGVNESNSAGKGTGPVLAYAWLCRMESDSPSPTGAHFHGWHQIGKSCQLALRRSPGHRGRARRPGIRHFFRAPAFRAAPLSVSRRQMRPRLASDRPRGIVHDWHPLATVDKLPWRGEILHSCSSAQSQDMANTAVMAQEQTDPMPSSLHSCTLGERMCSGNVRERPGHR